MEDSVASPSIDVGMFAKFLLSDVTTPVFWGCVGEFDFTGVGELVLVVGVGFGVFVGTGLGLGFEVGVGVEVGDGKEKEELLDEPLLEDEKTTIFDDPSGFLPAV